MQHQNNLDNLSIARAIIEIEDYCNEIEQGNVFCIDRDKIVLDELLNRLRAFEHIQKNWLRSFGIQANYSKIKKLNTELTPAENQYASITQKDLIHEAINETKKGIGFSIVFAEKLIADMESDRKYLEALHRHSELFAKVKECVSEVIKTNLGIINHVETRLSPTSLPSVYHLATLLKARYIPFNQSTEPLRGKPSEESVYKAACYGHAMDWKDEIEATGLYVGTPRSDKKNYLKHRSQNQNNYIHGKKCPSDGEIAFAVEELIQNLNFNNQIFRLSYGSNNTGHSMGFRQLKNNEIEFYDSNFGVFIFQDISSFKIWLSELLAFYLKDRKYATDFSIMIYKIGVQPLHATASIPQIKTSATLETKTETLLEIEKFKNKHIDNLELGIFNELRKYKPNAAKSPIHTVNHRYLSLKNNVNHAIDLEINRLKNVWIGDSKSKIHALTELKSIITHSNSSENLKFCVAKWLTKKSVIDSQKSNREIIQSSRIGNNPNTTTFQFIQNLVKNFEINLTDVRTKQAELFIKILNMIDLYEATYPILPATIKDICTLLSKSNNDVFDILTKIKNRCSENLTGLFAKTIKSRSEETDFFYKVIKNLDLNNPTSLNHATHALANLSKQITHSSKPAAPTYTS